MNIVLLATGIVAAPVLSWAALAMLLSVLKVTLKRSV